MKHGAALLGGACFVLVSLTGPTACARSEEDYAVLREQMMREIAAEAQEIAFETGRPELNPKVMQAMGGVPRHRFVPPDKQRQAYENHPLGIGHGQTISQPLIVALMTDLLELEPQHRVLEVGTGSGYQAAVLALLAREVYSIEIIEPLARDAAQRLRELGYKNVSVRAGDGYQGWKEHVPFDRIIVTAAAPKVPPPLIEQLKPGGRMVIPVGESFDVQELMVIDKNAEGKISSRRSLPVRFVPLTGEH